MPINEEVLHFVPTGTSKQHSMLLRRSIFSAASDKAASFSVRQLPDMSYVAVSQSGDHIFLSAEELNLLSLDPLSLPLERQAELQARFFLPSKGDDAGMQRLLDSRRRAKRETTEGGPSLHIIVPTLHCGHSCQYCQVSRSLDDESTTMSLGDLDAACDAVFESAAQSLTVEFQGGDPLLRFDLVERAVRRLTVRNRIENRNLRFVVASTLHQLTEEMCSFFRTFGVLVSTSIDGPIGFTIKTVPFLVEMHTKKP